VQHCSQIKKNAGIKQFGGFVLKLLEKNRVGIGMAVLLGGQAGNCAFVPCHGGFMGWGWWG
jgi:hypothetical protein